MKMTGIIIATVLATTIPSSVFAEVAELRIPLGAGGFGFLPLDIMQKSALIEKYAMEAGVSVKVNWSNIGGPAVMNDALLSGSAHFISAGPPAFLVLWDRTRSSVGVKGVAAISAMPMMLNVRAAQLRSLDDIQPNQKIAVTSVRVSIPSIVMQMHAAQKYGKAQASRFDASTVTMTHPDALISLLAGSGNIVGHWASSPYGERELKDPAIRSIMNTGDVMGGSTTFTMMSTTTKFRNDNPKLYGAVLKALERAQQMIAEDPKSAAHVLLESMGGKGWSVEELTAILMNSTTRYGAAPEHVIRYANFMHETGLLKNNPTGIKDLFFDSPEIAGGD